jgi:hypothetical protein
MTEELKISELPPLSPVPSGEIPISQMHGTARVTCKATVQELVQSVAPRAHSHTPADIGLGNVNNTSDANKPVSGPTATAIANALQTHVNATNPHEQYATTAQVTQIVTAQTGGLAPVQSVNGQQGAVTITKASIGLSNVDNTSDANKPVSTLQQAAIAGKVDSANARFTGVQRRKLVDIVWNVGGVTTIDPAMSPVFIDRSHSPSGSRKLQIATPPDNDDFEWFDVLLGSGASSPISPVNWMWLNQALVMGARDVIRFFRAPGIKFPGVDWVAMKMNA